MHGTDDAALAEIRRLRAFAQSTWLALAPPTPDIPEDGPDAANLVFDLGALVERRPRRPRVLLARQALARWLAANWPGSWSDGPEDAALARLAAMQDALAAAGDVVVFDPRHGQEMAWLGRRARVVSWPALLPDPLPPVVADVALLSFGAEAASLDTIRGLLQDALPMASFVEVEAGPSGPGAAAVHERALQARIHVHLGQLPASLAAWRVIESAAAGRPVVQLRSRAAVSETPDDEAEMVVRHRRTGLLAGGMAEAVDAVLRVTQDAPLADALRRQGYAAAATFNESVARALWWPAT